LGVATQTALPENRAENVHANWSRSRRATLYSSSMTLRRASILLAESGIASTRPDQSVNLMKRIGVPFEAPCRTHWHWWGAKHPRTASRGTILYDMFLLTEVPIPNVLSYDDACVIAASLTREIAL